MGWKCHTKNFTTLPFNSPMTPHRWAAGYSAYRQRVSQGATGNIDPGQWQNWDPASAATSPAFAAQCPGRASAGEDHACSHWGTRYHLHCPPHYCTLSRQHWEVTVLSTAEMQIKEQLFSAQESFCSSTNSRYSWCGRKEATGRKNIHVLKQG